ncbi:MAG TPA: hypothetical protein VN634_04645 [Candidatus Limnocylindrales bacterium]|nr:hypothetical protein [Candidatus Limnocylindrales bacterium]
MTDEDHVDPLIACGQIAQRPHGFFGERAASVSQEDYAAQRLLAWDDGCDRELLADARLGADALLAGFSKPDDRHVPSLTGARRSVKAIVHRRFVFVADSSWTSFAARDAPRSTALQNGDPLRALLRVVMH